MCAKAKGKMQKHYYQDSAVTIYHGDCREIIPQLGQFDLLLTDPPYGIKYDASASQVGGTKSKGGASYKTEHAFTNWDNQPIPLWLIMQSIDIAKKSIVWGGNYYHLPPTRCWLFWDKMNDGKTFADGELAWTNYECSLRRIQHLWDGMLQHDMGNKEMHMHPTQKPLRVIKWALDFANRQNEVQTILDPFAGSGTTGRAAKDLNKTAVLIEREERYCEIAANRMSQEVLAL